MILIYCINSIIVILFFYECFEHKYLLSIVNCLDYIRRIRMLSLIRRNTKSLLFHVEITTSQYRSCANVPTRVRFAPSPTGELHLGNGDITKIKIIFRIAEDSFIQLFICKEKWWIFYIANRRHRPRKVCCFG